MLLTTTTTNSHSHNVDVPIASGPDTAAGTANDLLVTPFGLAAALPTLLAAALPTLTAVVETADDIVTYATSAVDSFEVRRYATGVPVSPMTWVAVGSEPTHDLKRLSSSGWYQLHDTVVSPEMAVP